MLAPMPFISSKATREVSGATPRQNSSVVNTWKPPKKTNH
jgi:hypothetical protein